MEKVICPLCGKKAFSPLWSVAYFSKESLVALRLRDVKEICSACWGNHVEQLEKDEWGEFATTLMDELTGLESANTEMEEEKETNEKAMREEIEVLQDTLEDLKSRISEVLG